MKTKFFLVYIFILSVFLYTSCTEEEEPQPGDLNPTLNLTGGQGYISGNETVPVGFVFKIGINAFSSAETGAKLQKLTITRVFNNKVDMVLDSTLNTTNFTMDYQTVAVNEPGSENWTIKVTDKDNYFREASFTVTTEDIAGQITTYDQKILGAQASATGSSFASIDGTVYNLMDAFNNSAKIDWLYFYGATNLATLAAPDDDAAATIFTDEANGGLYALTNWAVRNATRFKMVTDPIDWNAITNDEVIVAQTASGVDLTRASQLSNGKFIAFIAASGKKGIIRVNSITGEQGGTIDISVKVQQ
jgi:hypothetical protein